MAETNSSREPQDHQMGAGECDIYRKVELSKVAVAAVALAVVALAAVAVAAALAAAEKSSSSSSGGSIGGIVVACIASMIAPLHSSQGS